MGRVTIAIIEQVSTDRVLIKCAYCSDEPGEDPHAHSACPVCKGRGTLLIEIDGELPMVRCSYCKDEPGEDPHGHRPCPACKGAGAQPAAGTMRVLT